MIQIRKNKIIKTFNQFKMIKILRNIRILNKFQIR